jgi:hypothetical protein
MLRASSVCYTNNRAHENDYKLRLRFQHVKNRERLAGGGVEVEGRVEAGLIQLIRVDVGRGG